MKETSLFRACYSGPFCCRNHFVTDIHPIRNFSRGAAVGVQGSEHRKGRGPTRQFALETTKREGGGGGGGGMGLSAFVASSLPLLHLLSNKLPDGHDN